MISVLGVSSALKRRYGIRVTYIPILDQYQRQSCGRLDFVAVVIHWISVAWSEGISHLLVYS